MKGTIPILNVIVRNDGMERVKRSIRYIFTISLPDSDHVIEVYLTVEGRREGKGERREIVMFGLTSH